MRWKKTENKWKGKGKVEGKSIVRVKKNRGIQKKGRMTGIFQETKIVRRLI